MDRYLWFVLHAVLFLKTFWLFITGQKPMITPQPTQSVLSDAH